MKKDLLDFYFDFATDILLSLNLDWGEVSRLLIMPKASTHTLGLCERNTDWWGNFDGTFTISLNPCLFQDKANEDIIIQTLLHELIHTMDGCFNHGKTFKYYASIINNKYGYHISRTTDSSKYGVELPEQKFKYEIWCNVCNKRVARYKRETRIVKLIERDGGSNVRCNCCKTKGQFKCIRLH